MDFKKLYREESQKPAKPAAEADKEQPKSPLVRLRPLAGSILLIGGAVLFSLQSISSSDSALPINSIITILVEDLSVLEEPETQAEPGPAAPESEQQEGEDEQAPQRPSPFGHYLEEPSDDLVRRLRELVGGIEEPIGVKAIQVQMRILDARFVVPAGAAPSEPNQLFGEPRYTIISLPAADARALLGSSVEQSTALEGRLLLGPFPYNAPEGVLELVDGEARRDILATLPPEASALQGVLVAVEEDIKPNALILVPSGQTSVDAFHRAGSEFINALVSRIAPPPAPAEDGRQAEAAPAQRGENPFGLMPRLSISDYRHQPPAFLLAFFGEMIFLGGGFLLIYHLFGKIAARKSESKIAAYFIDACGVVASSPRLYALVVALLFAFWGWGMVSAYVSPAEQSKMVIWISQQLNSGAGPLGTAAAAYASGNIIMAALLTFVINPAIGTVLFLTLLSLLPTAWAFIISALRNSWFGLALSPTALMSGQHQAPHLLTILIESQGYVLAAFFSVLLLLAVVKPERFGMENRWLAYKQFALWQLRVLPLIGVTLLIAAVYEAVEIIVLSRLF